MGKHGFYNGGKSENFKSNFWPENYINMGQQYTKRCRIATFGGVCFLRKVEFSNIFMRKSRFKIFEITIEFRSEVDEGRKMVFTRCP
jgi:hypothetical protein